GLLGDAAELVARHPADGAVPCRSRPASRDHHRGCVLTLEPARSAPGPPRARRSHRLHPRNRPSDRRPALGRRKVNMDLKKKIKLSDLLKRPKRAKKPAPALQGSNGKARTRPRKTKGELVGIKIGATQLAASRVANNGSPHVLQLAREDLPAGVVAGGEVRSVPALASALDEFFTKHVLPRRGVRLGVATNRMRVPAFEVAGIDDDAQLANAVRFRAHEAVGIPLDQAVLDYKVLSESVDGAGKRNRRILVVAAYRESIDRYTDAFKEAGIELAGIDLEAFGLLRAVTPPAKRPEGVESAVVAVTIGHERTTLAISDGAVCDFTRVLEWGGSTLTSAIERRLNISSTEASELKLG